MNKLTKETLEQLYLIDKLSTRDIADKLHCGQTTVCRYLKDFNIKTRNQLESQNTEKYLDKKAKLSERYKTEYLERSIQNEHRCNGICPQCGKEYTYKKSQFKKYCSKECANKAKIKQHFCKKCGKLLTSKHAKYCSECLTQHRHDIAYKRIKTKCGYCSKDIEVIPHDFEQNEKCYCNIDCMAKDYQSCFSGENSPSWKGGKRHYQGHWLRQRLLATQRDNCTCQRCGITEEQQGCQLSVHHIKNYRDFDNKEEANQLDNLVSLCHACHTFVHSNKNVNSEFIKK